MGNEANKEYTLPELAEAAGIQVHTAQHLLKIGVIVGEERGEELIFTQQDIEEIKRHLKQRAMDKIYAETGRFDQIKHWS